MLTVPCTKYSCVTISISAAEGSAEEAIAVDAEGRDSEELHCRDHVAYPDAEEKQSCLTKGLALCRARGPSGSTNGKRNLRQADCRYQ